MLLGLDSAHKPKNSAHSTWTRTEAAWVRWEWRRRRWLAHAPLLGAFLLAGLYLWLFPSASAEPAPGDAEWGILVTVVVVAVVVWAGDRIYRCPVCGLRPRRVYEIRYGQALHPKKCETCGVPLA
ncbi:MAG: hypothetical protein NDJ94_22040 [Vicinamibacteria bacterium]|jgi:hypothetical protein|nr:hypothetical protein [Vicinamibacteria bacterium]